MYTLISMNNNYYGFSESRKFLSNFPFENERRALYIYLYIYIKGNLCVDIHYEVKGAC